MKYLLIAVVLVLMIGCCTEKDQIVDNDYPQKMESTLKQAIDINENQGTGELVKRLAESEKDRRLTADESRALLIAALRHQAWKKLNKTNISDQELMSNTWKTLVKELNVNYYVNSSKGLYK